MRRYFFRLGVCLTAYALLLIGGLLAAVAGVPVGVRVFLAFANAAAICGVFWTIFRLVEECDDEYQRLLFIRQILFATALTLAVTTVWQFLEVYRVVATGPRWIGVLWLASFGIAAPIVR